MGENANVKWSWHNSEVGVGYQARGVIRQRYAESATSKTIDYRNPVVADLSKSDSNANSINSKESMQPENKSSRRKHSADHFKAEKPKKRPKKIPKFNPLLQNFASSISDTTRTLSVNL